MRVFQKLTFVLFLLIAVHTLSALEYRAGEYTLRILPDSGRFSLSYNFDGEDIPLFFSDNPRTSGMQLSYGDATIRLGDEKNIITTVQEFSDAVILSFAWDDLIVEQVFSFVKSGDSVIGLEVTYRLTNLTNSPVTGNLRQLIDTTMGESGGSHFITASGSGLTREYRFVPSAAEASITSGSAERGLHIILAGQHADPPAQLIAANWKRLNETIWDYSIRESRNFNLLPFSINDSAIALYYGPFSIPAQGVQSYRLFLQAADGNLPVTGNIHDSYVVFNDEAETVSTIVEVPLEGVLEEGDQADYSPEELAKIAPYVQDIETLDVLLEQIDRLLASPVSLTPEQIRALREILRTIQGNL